MEANAFDSVAAFYEVFAHSEERLRREEPLLRKVLAQAPGKQVLDVACGTGLHAALMSEMGAQVTAMDISPDMIREAETRRPHPNIQYAVCDMRAVCGGPWDLALCLGNSLSLLPEPEDLRQTFDAIAVALAPHGLFLLQVLNYQSQAAQQPRHRVERKRVDDIDVVAVKNLVPHGDRTLLSLTFLATDPGGAVKTFSETALLRNLDRERVLDTAAAAGFEAAAVYGGFDGEPYAAADSPDLICLLRKLA